MAKLGMWHGDAWQILEIGMAWHSMAWHGMAWHGKSMAWQIHGMTNCMAMHAKLHGDARQMAWRWHGGGMAVAWRGMVSISAFFFFNAWHGDDSIIFVGRMAWHGMARHGIIDPLGGKAWHGMAWQNCMAAHGAA